MDHLQGRSVLLAIAHPDDEAMFFGPTLRQLEKNENELHLLCFSIGNESGFGKIREKELKLSCCEFGIKNLDIIDDERLQDGMENIWEPEYVAEFLRKYISKWNIEVLITFDEGGVSAHPNHSAVSFASLKLNIPVLHLVTLPLYVKYCPIYPSSMGNYSYQNSWDDVSVCQRAMYKCHKSQMRWFRWAWILFSRYMYSNELKEI